MKKIVVTLIVLGLVGIGVWGFISSDLEFVDGESSDREDTTRPSGDFGRDDTGLNETTCSATGGTWNPCGSACRTDPDAICIELCVEYCECKTEVQCPSGYICGDVVEGVGVCLSDADY